MASFNKVILIGNLTADAELKQSGSGVSVCSFSIAVNRKMSKNNECDFITCVAWRQQAEFVSKYFKKGQPILVCGQLQTRTRTDSNGNKRYATEVIADEVSFIAPRESSAVAKNEASTYTSNVSSGVTAESAIAAFQEAAAREAEIIRRHHTDIPGAYTNNSQNFEEIHNDGDLPF